MSVKHEGPLRSMNSLILDEANCPYLMVSTTFESSLGIKHIVSDLRALFLFLATRRILCPHGYIGFEMLHISPWHDDISRR